MSREDCGRLPHFFHFVVELLPPAKERRGNLPPVLSRVHSNVLTLNIPPIPLPPKTQRSHPIQAHAAINRSCPAEREVSVSFASYSRSSQLLLRMNQVELRPMSA